MNSKYLKYLFKSNITGLLVLLFIPLIIFLVNIGVSNHIQLHYQNNSYMGFRAPDLTTILVLFIFISFYLGKISTRFFSSRRQVDVYYSIPESKRVLLTTNIAFSLISIFLINLIVYFCGIGLLLLKTSTYFYEISYSFTNIMIIFIVIFSFSVFLYFMSIFSHVISNKNDGSFIQIFYFAISMISMTFILAAVATALYPDSSQRFDASNYDFIIFAFLINNYFPMSANQKALDIDYSLFAITISLTILVFFAFVILSYIYVDKKKAENINEVSSHPLAYNFVIPYIMMFGFFGIFKLIQREGYITLIYFVLLLVVWFFLYLNFRRKIVFKPLDYALLPISALFGYFLTFVQF